MLAQLDLNSIEGRGLPGLNKAFMFKSGGLGAIITEILPYVYYAAGLGLLFYLLMGGLQLMLAKGDPKAIQSAQVKITNAFIGFIIVFSAYFLTRFVATLLGLDTVRTIFK